ncbi:MAG: hypothetical protein QOI10_4211, partial [Solirubrobacterales bacterium]|nr:hypothetical protein [Solirubrobacterales bacterium]
MEVVNAVLAGDEPLQVVEVRLVVR